MPKKNKQNTRYVPKHAVSRMLTTADGKQIEPDFIIQTYADSIKKLEQSYILVWYWMRCREGYSAEDSAYVVINAVEKSGYGTVYGGKIVECTIPQMVLENDMSILQRECPELIDSIDSELATHVFKLDD